ncbi:hypothetical protein [Pseudomonas japonica]|uniref:hypothetical protein n=1 Tax=Pseudomonas japonica TaxID=256466 RepID=UPI0015E3755C|nr:hypothetical protein [Pseudomonas japonica]MBA1245917.1 hypothetical protein [Pseudomonas japonica]
MGSLIVLDRNTLHELEGIERLAAKLGSVGFRDLALQLAYNYPVDIEAPYQSIRKSWNSSIIGMSHAPFEVMRTVREAFIERAPELLRILSYRYRHEDRTTVPRSFWLVLVEKASTDGASIDNPEGRPFSGLEYASFVARCGDLVEKNQAGIDFEFLRQRQVDGDPSALAVEELIARRRDLVAAPD